MKSVYELTDEIIFNTTLISSFDKTKILVFTSYILDKPYRSHRLELKMYSIRYKASDNYIYIYNKYNNDINEDIDCLDDFDITTDYNVKISIKKNIKDVKVLLYKIKKFIKKIKSKLLIIKRITIWLFFFIFYGTYKY